MILSFLNSDPKVLDTHTSHSLKWKGQFLETHKVYKKNLYSVKLQIICPMRTRCGSTVFLQPHNLTDIE